MDYLVQGLSDLLYSLFCGALSALLPLFFIVMALQFITGGRTDPGRAIGSITRVASSAARSVTGGRRRR